MDKVNNIIGLFNKQVYNEILQLDNLEQLLLSLDQNDKNKFLYDVCYYGNIHLARYLLNAGADPNAEDCLNVAYESGFLGLINLLKSKEGSSC